MNRRRALAALAGIAAPAVFGGASRLERYREEILSGRTRSGILTCDTFDRADGTDLGSTNNLPFLPGRPGIAWSEVAGNWEINTRRIGSQGSSPGGQGWIVTLDIGVSDYELSWTLAYSPDVNSNAIVVAYIDGTNFLRLVHNSTALGWGRISSGVNTNIGTNSTGVTPTLGDTIVIRKTGAAYSASIVRAGVVVGTAATIASETQGQSSTVVGLRAGPANVRWTNFIARR